MGQFFLLHAQLVGRSCKTDPLGYIDGMNLYQYCGNNPVNWIDPWGLCGDKSWMPNAGFEITGSTVNPFSSSGGGVYGWENIMSFDDGTAAFGYHSEPLHGHGGAIGLDVGVNARGVFTWGSGSQKDWPGKFKSIEVNYGFGSFAYFWAPGGGYKGIAFGPGIGLPGIAYEETTYFPH